MSSTSRETVGSGPWKLAVSKGLRRGYGVEDIALHLDCRVDAVRGHVATLRRLGILAGICKRRLPSGGLL